MDLGDTFSSFCSNASSMVRKKRCSLTCVADSAVKVSIDGRDDRNHVFQSAVIGAPGAYVPFPSHSILSPIGPTAWILMLDCRCVNYNPNKSGFLTLSLLERNES